MADYADLENRIRSIEDRNRRVETDKAWESSWTRRISIMAITYAVVSIYLMLVHNDRPFANALVPPAGFLFSTLILPSIRSWWQDHR